MIEEILNIKVNENELAIFWFGQNSFILKTSTNKLIALDPYFSRSQNSRYIHSSPPIHPEEVIVDYVFCTHNHRDHTDPETLYAIHQNSPNTVFFGPIESYHTFRKLGIPLNCARRLEVDITMKIEDFKVTPVNSIIGNETDNKGNNWITHYGYIFNFGFLTLYNMGDSSNEVAKFPMKVFRKVIPFSPDIAILPIIGDFPNRKPEDALKFAKIIQSKIIIPSHYGCFQDRTIDPEILVKLFKDVPNIKVHIIEYNDKFLYKNE